MKITDRKHLDQYRKEFLAHIDTQTKKVYVCGGTGCVAGGSMEIYDEFKSSSRNTASDVTFLWILTPVRAA